MKNRVLSMGYFWILILVAGIRLGFPGACAADGQDLYASGDYAGTVAAFTEELATAEGTEKDPILNNIGTSSMARGDPETAAWYYKQAVDADPGYGRGWINLGVVQEKLGKPEEAFISYEKVTDKDPAIFADAMVKKKTLLSGLERLDEVLTVFQEITGESETRNKNWEYSKRYL